MPDDSSYRKVKIETPHIHIFEDTFYTRLLFNWKMSRNKKKFFFRLSPLGEQNGKSALNKLQQL